MTIIDNSGDRVTTLTWSHKLNRSDGTSSSSGGNILRKWYVKDYRTRNRNDPLGRLYHGFYQREFQDFSSYPMVSATLVRESRYTTIKSYHTSMVSGVGFGFAPFRSRYLYEEEQSKFLLINNCIKGALEQSVDLATFIAELDKTGDLLASKASKIASAASQIRKGQFTRAARTLGVKKPRGASRSKSFSNNLLEYQYGWAPIIQDSVGLMEHIYKSARNLRVKSRSRTSSVVNVNGSNGQTELWAYAASQDRLLCSWYYSSKWERHEQVDLLFRLNSGFWDQVNRLGFLNPGQITYQTLPGSFLLDWFSNLGDVISAMSLELTLDYITGGYTQFHRNYGTVTGSPFWTDQNSNYKYTKVLASVATGQYSDYRIKREIIPWSEVAVTFRLSAPLSFNKVLTAAALVRQQFR